MNAFRDLAKQRQPEPENDGYAKLLCTEPGCGQLWTVSTGGPKCSYHQWGARDKRHFENMSRWIGPSEGSDRKEWARRIVRAHESGALIRPQTLKMAEGALRGRA